MTARHTLSIVAVLVAFGVFSIAALAGSNTAGLVIAKQSTAGFVKVGSAEAAGYTELRDAKHIACISMPGMGAMGIHYVNGKLVGDGVLDVRHPEGLVYEPKANGEHLVALEYIVFEKAWKHAQPPHMFGHVFNYTPAGNRFGLPAFWSLHAWIWKHNPAGTLTPWNPKVTCPY